MLKYIINFQSCKALFEPHFHYVHACSKAVLAEEVVALSVAVQIRHIRLIALMNDNGQ
jgi:hypothetical protein